MVDAGSEPRWFGTPSAVPDCAKRGRRLFRAAGFPPHDQSDWSTRRSASDTWLADPRLLRSAVRRSLIEQRDRAIESVPQGGSRSRSKPAHSSQRRRERCCCGAAGSCPECAFPGTGQELGADIDSHLPRRTRRHGASHDVDPRPAAPRPAARARPVPPAYRPLTPGSRRGSPCQTEAFIALLEQVTVEAVRLDEPVAAQAGIRASP